MIFKAHIDIAQSKEREREKFSFSVIFVVLSCRRKAFLLSIICTIEIFRRVFFRSLCLRECACVYVCILFIGCFQKKVFFLCCFCCCDNGFICSLYNINDHLALSVSKWVFFVSHPIHFSVVLVPFFTFSSSIYTCSVRLEFYPRNVIFKNSEKKQTKLTIAISCWIKKANIVFQIHYIS